MNQKEIHLFEPHSIIQKKYFNVISVYKTWIGRPLLRPSGRYRRGHKLYGTEVKQAVLLKVVHGCVIVDVKIG